MKTAEEILKHNLVMHQGDDSYQGNLYLNAMEEYKNQALQEQNREIKKWQVNAYEAAQFHVDALQEIELLKEYQKLLGDELNDTAQIAAIHGWKSKRLEEGERLREQISKFKK